MGYTSAFSEKAFLNSYYFQYLSPSERQEHRVQTPKASIIETLQNIEPKLYALPHKGIGHNALKPVRFVARVVYTLFVSIIVAPTGALYHGVQALRYANTDANKANMHTLCMDKDLRAARDLSTIVLLVALSTLVFPREVILAYFLCSFTPFVARFGLAPDGVAELIGGKNSRELYMSLKTRNDLGLVGPDGNLLPYTLEDKDEELIIPAGTIISLEELQARNPCPLREMIVSTEKSLIAQIRAANGFATRHGLNEIQFQYPFDGRVIAKKLQTSFPQGPEKDEYIEKIKTTHAKFIFLESLIYNVNKGEIREWDWTDHLTRSVRSYLSEAEYRELFANGVGD